jgi:hypothetical protein
MVLRGFALGESDGSLPALIVVPIAPPSWATLIMSAEPNDVDPQAWLADVLARIADMPLGRLEQLLPWNWQPLSP